jgi:hypothetical protein
MLTFTPHPTTSEGDLFGNTITEHSICTVRSTVKPLSKINVCLINRRERWRNRECHVLVEAETKVLELQTRKHRDGQKKTQSQEEARKYSSLQISKFRLSCCSREEHKKKAD